MKTKLIAPLIAVMTFGLASWPAGASQQSSNSLGEVVPLAAAKPTIRMDARTKYMNVTEHETVKFETSGTVFATYFREYLRGVPYGFDLNQLAPAGALDYEATVWVAPDPLYLP